MLAACLVTVVLLVPGLVGLAGLAVSDAAGADPSAIAAIRQVFGARSAAAVRVARCETGGTFNPRAANWSDRHSDGSRGSFGLFQIGALHRDKRHGETVSAFARRMFDPIANSRFAYRLSRGGTRWTPWSCRP